ncbi:MAG: 3-dehydroquinate synthase [Fimbriimonadales bacterium]
MEIRTRNGSYEVRLLDVDGAVAALPAGSVVVTDENVAALYGGRLPASVPCVAVQPGEGSKSLPVYQSVVERLLDLGADRGSTVVALGGGVVGDLAGFVAATYLRGVRLVQVPTSLVAMVDSSVGGKVGLDLPSGKNLIGAFYPPSEVLVPIDALATLPRRHLANGMAEVWKYAYILDRSLGELLESFEAIPEGEHMAEVVARCICLKAEVVEQDELDRAGRRAILNFGHTVGHALEVLTGYGPLLHGEAVAIGMVAEAKLGERLGLTPSGMAERIREDLQRVGLPTTHELLRSTGELLRAMRRDKKTEAGVLAFSLLIGYGSCQLVAGVSESDVECALMEACEA